MIIARFPEYRKYLVLVKIPKLQSDRVLSYLEAGIGNGYG